MNSRIAAKGVSKTTDRQGDHGVQHVPLALAIEAAGPLLTAAISARMDRTASWLAVIDAAADVAPLMGIDKTLWSEACGALGRHGAALAILIIERGSELRDVAGRSPPIQRPPAYLRGMLARGRTGALRLDRSVRGWALRKT